MWVRRISSRPFRCQSRPFEQIVLELCSAGSLLDILKGIKRPFTDEEIAIVTFCVVHGLCCLHDALVIHR
jgi:serine/threonine protein kinase